MNEYNFKNFMKKEKNNIIYYFTIMTGVGIIITGLMSLSIITLINTSTEASNLILPLIDVDFEVDSSQQIMQLMISAKICLIIGAFVVLFALYMLINKEKGKNSVFLKILFVFAIFSIPLLLLLIEIGGF